MTDTCPLCPRTSSAATDAVLTPVDLQIARPARARRPRYPQPGSTTSLPARPTVLPSAVGLTFRHISGHSSPIHLVHLVIIAALTYQTATMSSSLLLHAELPPQSYILPSQLSAPTSWSNLAPGHTPYTPRTTPPPLTASPTSSSDYFSRRIPSYHPQHAYASVDAHTHPLPTPISPDSQPGTVDADCALPLLGAAASARAARYAALGLPADVARPLPAHLVEDWEALPDLLRQPMKKDGGPPRPMNAYFIFMRVRRPRIAEANPTLTTGQISSLLGKEWAALDHDDKAVYNDLADRHLRSFKKKFPDYQYERASKKKAAAAKAGANGARVVSRSVRGVEDPYKDQYAAAARTNPYASAYHAHAHAAYAPQHHAQLGHGYPHGGYYYAQPVYQQWPEQQVTYDPRAVPQHYYPTAAYAHPQATRQPSGFYMSDGAGSPKYQ
ncbi:hypothetical protein Q5752_001094 [Cryptotrichosporon argae]